MSLTFNEDPVFVKVKRALLARGSGGLKTAVRAFRNAQDSKGELSAAQFKTLLESLGAPVSGKDFSFLVLAFRKRVADDQSPIDVNVVVKELHGGLNKRRLAVVEEAFAQLSGTSSVAKASDLLQTYRGSAFAATIRTQSESESTSAFQATFRDDDDVTKEEFLAYYCGVSAGIPLDLAFEQAVLRTWNADKSEAPRMGETQRTWGTTEGDTLEIYHSALVKEALSSTFLAIEKIKAYDYSHGKRVHLPNPPLPIVLPDYVTTTARSYPSYSATDIRKSDPILARTLGLSGY